MHRLSFVPISIASSLSLAHRVARSPFRATLFPLFPLPFSSFSLLLTLSLSPAASHLCLSVRGSHTQRPSRRRSACVCERVSARGDGCLLLRILPLSRRRRQPPVSLCLCVCALITSTLRFSTLSLSDPRFSFPSLTLCVCEREERRAKRQSSV